jgi:predicted RNase H-like HicB family nuclease
MDTFEIDLEPADAHGFTVTIPALPGLLILGSSLDEVLEQARASIAWHARTCERGHPTERIALVTRNAPQLVVPGAR